MGGQRSKRKKKDETKKKMTTRNVWEKTQV